MGWQEFALPVARNLRSEGLASVFVVCGEPANLAGQIQHNTRRFKPLVVDCEVLELWQSQVCAERGAMDGRMEKAVLA